jgi:hypothetical protein
MLMKASTGLAVEAGLTIAGLVGGDETLTTSPTAAFVNGASATTGLVTAGGGVDAKIGLTGAGVGPGAGAGLGLATGLAGGLDAADGA